MAQGFFSPLAKSARQALSIQKDSFFRLLVVMMALMGWLIAAGGAGMVGLQTLYTSWQLEQKSQMSVYLLPETESTAIAQLETTLLKMEGVKSARMLDQNATRDVLTPYLGDTPLPLPRILNLTVTPDVNHKELRRVVAESFPDAEVEDTRDMLATIAGFVRFGQMLALGLSALVLAIMAVLVAMTVSAGMRGKQGALVIMEFVGASDAFLTRLITRQVFKQALLGWVLATLLGAASLGGVMLVWPVLAQYVTPLSWITVAAMPLVLVGLVVLTARYTATRVMAQKGRI